MELKLTTASGDTSSETIEVSEAAFNKDFNGSIRACTNLGINLNHSLYE